MKLLIIGHGRHGKDTVCDILADKYHMSFQSSSAFCAEHVVFPVLSELYGYSNFMQCFDDRHNHRTEWFNLISEYCETDGARLGREIFSEYDIYGGLRNPREFAAMKEQKVFDWCVWVDRSQHLPTEPFASMGLTVDHADYIVNNNGSLSDLAIQVDNLMKELNSV